MPYKENYPAILLKKRVADNRFFWPRISLTLAMRLDTAAGQHTFNIDTVLDEIAYLESPDFSKPTATKPQEQLRGPLLGRYWHKHFMDAGHLGQNVQNHWFGPFAKKHGLLGQEIRKWFESWGDVAGAELTEPEGRVIAGRLAHEIVHGACAKRSARRAMTGEWIIYYVHNGQNFYLDIAFHSELQDEQALVDRLRSGCEEEYPFAFASC